MDHKNCFSPFDDLSEVGNKNMALSILATLASRSTPCSRRAQFAMLRRFLGEMGDDSWGVLQGLGVWGGFPQMTQLVQFDGGKCPVHLA